MEIETKNLRVLNILKNSYQQENPYEEAKRKEGQSYTNLSELFLLRRKNFNLQYAHIYFNRLVLTRPLLLKKLQFHKLTPCKVVQIALDQEIQVIGTLFKEMKRKPSVLHRLNDNNLDSCFEPKKYEKRTSPEDFMYLEDETGRIKLNFSEYQFDDSDNDIIVDKAYSARELVTGLIVAVIGKTNAIGTFFVHKLIFCDVPNNINETVFERIKQEKRLLNPSESKNRISNYITAQGQENGKNDDEFIALVSGINFSNSEGQKNLKKLSNFLFGEIPDIKIRKVTLSF